jgi:hypothetical protein
MGTAVSPLKHYTTRLRLWLSCSLKHPSLGTAMKTLRRYSNRIRVQLVGNL